MNDNARIPNRPLSLENKELAIPKELVVDYKDRSIYISDENGDILPATAMGGGYESVINTTVNKDGIMIGDKIHGIEVDNCIADNDNGLLTISVLSGNNNYSNFISGEIYVFKFAIQGGLTNNIDNLMVELICDNSIGTSESGILDVIDTKVEQTYDDINEFFVNTFLYVTVKCTNPPTIYHTLYFNITTNGSLYFDAGYLESLALHYPYSANSNNKKINIPEIKQTDNPVVDLVVSEDYDIAKVQIENYNKIYKISTFDGYIQVFTSEPIDIDLDLILKVNRVLV